MTIARKEIVAEGEERAYHCTSRCVRQAYLCGFQALTGRNYDHRKVWVQQRLKFLSGVFAVEVLGYAVMSDHQHVVPRMIPARAREWSAEEVARRWLLLRRARPTGDVPEDPAWAERQAAIVRDAERVEVLRGRLCSLSWFMAELDEHLARRANAEDGCRGRFWEGRFKAKALLDEAALLTCLVYVDLNPIRAGLAATPETSDFTSTQDWIRSRAEPVTGGRSREAVGAACAAGTSASTCSQPKPYQVNETYAAVTIHVPGLHCVKEIITGPERIFDQYPGQHPIVDLICHTVLVHVAGSLEIPRKHAFICGDINGRAVFGIKRHSQNRRCRYPFAYRDPVPSAVSTAGDNHPLIGAGIRSSSIEDIRIGGICQHIEHRNVWHRPKRPTGCLIHCPGYPRRPAACALVLFHRGKHHRRCPGEHH